MARSFWGRRWCAHLESFSDYANRLPRGRTYARGIDVAGLYPVGQFLNGGHGALLSVIILKPDDQIAVPGRLA